MTILTKEALEKIRKEVPPFDEEDPDSIDSLFRELEDKMEEKKEKEEVHG